jgi:hypothetical protein
MAIAAKPGATMAIIFRFTLLLSIEPGVARLQRPLGVHGEHGQQLAQITGEGAAERRAGEPRGS